MNLFRTILDRSVVFSFDRSGFLHHQAEFKLGELDRLMTGKVCLVTGANSGIGFEAAKALAARNAGVHLLCRNPGRGEQARQAIIRATGNADVQVHAVDVADQRSVRAFAEEFAPAQVDVLVHNAGLLPLQRTFSPEGLELTVATHVVGPHLLNKLLRPKLLQARVIFVSSGGMYAKRLDVAKMLFNDGPYDGVAAYAMTKRAQVVLSELWAEQLAPTVVHAMHPGWAATPGVEHSLPRFEQMMQNRLRSAEQGADTVVWLAVAERAAQQTGKFWFDRQAVPTHLLPWTKESAEERRRLWEFCEQSCSI